MSKRVSHAHAELERLHMLLVVSGGVSADRKYQALDAFMGDLRAYAPWFNCGSEQNLVHLLRRQQDVLVSAAVRAQPPSARSAAR